jgi:ribonuclease E
LPAEPEPAAKPARARRARGGRKPKAEDAVEADVIAQTAEAVAEPTPEPERAIEPAPEPELEPELELATAPVAAAVSTEPEPVTAAPAPDAAEISAPPVAPKRGWWRRGG